MTEISFPDLVFYGVAAAVVGSALYAVVTHNIVRAVFSLLATFFGVAVLYGMLAADFVAVVQLMVYVGGILILLLFAVMLTSRIDAVDRSNRSGSWLVSLGIGLVLLALLVTVAIKTPWREVASLPEAQPTTTLIGNELSGPLAVPFVLVGLVLLGCVIGAVTLARRTRKVEAR